MWCTPQRNQYQKLTIIIMMDIEMSEPTTEPVSAPAPVTTDSEPKTDSADSMQVDGGSLDEEKKTLAVRQSTSLYFILCGLEWLTLIFVVCGVMGCCYCSGVLLR